QSGRHHRYPTADRPAGRVDRLLRPRLLAVALGGVEGGEGLLGDDRVAPGVRAGGGGGPAHSALSSWSARIASAASVICAKNSGCFCCQRSYTGWVASRNIARSGWVTSRICSNSE